MPFVSQKNLVRCREAIYESIKKPETFTGLILLLLSLEKKEKRYIEANMSTFSNYADKAFYLAEDNTSHPEKSWFALLSRNFLEISLKYFLSNQKASGFHYAVTLFWYKNFDSPRDLLNWFKEELGAENFEYLFTDEIDDTINFDGTAPCDRTQLLEYYNGSVEKRTLKYDGSVIKARAGATGAAPYGQTLYTSTEVKKIISVFDFDFLNDFSLAIDDKVKVLPPGKKQKSVYTKYKSSSVLNPTLSKSLLSKPFVILTGASGTGKTMQAKELASHFTDELGTNSVTVAVGADWTDNRSTLGFVNYLTPEGDEPVYQSTEILNLLQRANADINTPYFLILDEMNLSHVERYFADFLSVMEQGEKGYFNLHSEGASLKNSAEGESGVPMKLQYPSNLFVIGTVNIDETTYMFSPKVLDRANVIEYKVNATELGAFLDHPHEPAEVEPAERGQAEQFLALARETRGAKLAELPDEIREKVKTDIMQLFTLMQERRYEFAYRTVNEITRYLKVSMHLAEDTETWASGGWQDSLDEQILQKVLPKLHGSIGRVGKLIAQLAQFTHNPTAEDFSDRLADVGGLTAEDAIYKESCKKLKAMAQTLQDEQFVSFI